MVTVYHQHYRHAQSIQFKSVLWVKIKRIMRLKIRSISCSNAGFIWDCCGDKRADAGVMTERSKLHATEMTFLYGLQCTSKCEELSDSEGAR